MFKTIVSVELSNLYRYSIKYRPESDDFIVCKTNRLKHSLDIISGDIFTCANYILKEAKPCDFTI